MTPESVLNIPPMHTWERLDGQPVMIVGGGEPGDELYGEEVRSLGTSY